MIVEEPFEIETQGYRFMVEPYGKFGITDYVRGMIASSMGPVSGSGKCPKEILHQVNSVLDQISKLDEYAGMDVFDLISRMLPD